MHAAFDRRRTVFIHDFDGVHFNYADKEDHINFLCDCGAMAGVSLLKNVDHDTSKRLHRDAFFNHGKPHVGYFDIARAQGFSEEAFMIAYTRAYHQYKYTRVRTESPAWIRPSPATQDAFARLRGNVRHGLLTQSNVQFWAGPALKDLGLYEFFEPDCLLGFEECECEIKSLSTRPLEIALERMDARPEETVFIEDSLKNLAKAKELDPAICNVYVCHGAPLAEMPPYVDIQVDTLQRFIQAAVRIHAAPRGPAATP